jgi:hypothetical protein
MLPVSVNATNYVMKNMDVLTFYVLAAMSKLKP